MFPTIKVTPIARHTTNSPWFSQAFVRGGKEFKGRSSIYPLEYWLGTKCTDARYFLQQFSVVYGKNLINFFICSWKSAWHKIIILQTLYCLFSRLYNFLNPTGPFCTRVSSICPSTKDRKRDWKCYHCSELVCRDHFNRKIQITCNSCKEQS